MDGLGHTMCNAWMIGEIVVFVISLLTDKKEDLKREKEGFGRESSILSIWFYHFIGLSIIWTGFWAVIFLLVGIFPNSAEEGGSHPSL